MATYTRKEYTESDAVKQALAALEEKKASKPGAYTSQWQSQLDSALDALQNRESFRYDPGSDGLYQQYRDRYIREGRLAMMDTMGQAAALTGGYGNSYSQTAGQQTYQGYLQGLNDALPELYRLAMERYRMEGDALQDRYDILLRQDGLDYDRYRDTVSDWEAAIDRLQKQWQAERDFDYGRYTDEEDFAYDAYRDSVADEQWNQQFQYQQSQDALAYQQWLQEFEEDRRRYEQDYALQQAMAAAKNNSSYRGGSSGGSGSSKTKEVDQEAKNFVDNMLKNATGSQFDPQRVISGTNVLNQSQKAEAQEYLSQLLAQGRMT